jgi:hypothetical protein
MKQPVHYLAALLLGLAAALATLSAQAQQTVLTTLKPGIWLCVSPKVYDEAMVRVNEVNGKDVEPLRKELGEQKKCMFVDQEMVESMMAPFALVLKREGSKVQVQFVIAERKRIEFLHRLTNRYVLVGWTEEANLVPKQIM